MILQAKPTMLDIVINTGPLIAMVAATGKLNWLPSLYGRIVIPYEVLLEIESRQSSASGPRAIGEFVSWNRSARNLSFLVCVWKNWNWEKHYRFLKKILKKG
jgi:hypothetical protein